MAKEFTNRQKLFIAAYLKTKNATQAAIAAGYSEKAARVQGSRLLSNAAIKAQIESGVISQIAKFNVCADEILWEIKKLGFYDVRKLYNEDGTPKPIKDLDDESAAAIVGVEVEEIFAGRGKDRVQIGRVLKYRLADKGLNLERLGRYRKLFTDKVEVTPKGGPLVITDARTKLLAKLSSGSLSGAAPRGEGKENRKPQ